MMSFLNLTQKIDSSPQVPVSLRVDGNLLGVKVYSYLLALVLPIDYNSCQTPSSSL